jgi:hypothetical protein
MSVYNTHRKRDLFADISAADLIELRGYMCEICEERHGTQRHHALVRRDYRFRELDVLINYQLVCEVCNTETCEADSKDNRLNFYLLQCDRYGKNVVDDWYDGLPFKHKERIG